MPPNLEKTVRDDLRPSLLEEYISGVTIPAHEGHPLDLPPPWMDPDKCRRGKEFAQKHLLPVLIGHFFSMMCIFVWPPIFQVVLYTKNLDSIKKAARRNFGNLVYFRSWYFGDFWDKTDSAYRSMTKVQMMHKFAGTSTNSNPDKVKLAKAEMTLEPDITSLCNTWTIFRDDLSTTRYDPGVYPLEVPEQALYVSQVDHIITVLGLITPTLVSTSQMGIHGATDDDLECFVHLWRVIGYHLGIQDRYNPCEGTLTQVRARCQDLIDGVVFPAFQDMNQQKEYIMRVSVDSLFQKASLTSFMTYEVMTTFMLRGLGIPVPSFYKSMSLKSKLSYWVLRFIASGLLQVPFVLRFLNYLIGWQVNRITQRENKSGKSH